MMKYLKYISYTTFLIWLFACSDDESTDPLADVPQGEIVEVEKRDGILSGESEVSDGRTLTYKKWWKQANSKIVYNGCGEGFEDQDLSLIETYFAFTSSGKLYYKTGTDGTAFYSMSWEWADDAKDAIILSDFPTVEFELRALNENELIYASVQEESGCSAVTWEEFGDPIIEEDKEVEAEEFYGSILTNDLEHNPYLSVIYDGEYENAPRFPSNKYQVREFDWSDVGLEIEHVVTIGDPSQDEPEIEITFHKGLKKGATYYLQEEVVFDGSNSDELDILYSNAKPFSEEYTLESMQEVLDPDGNALLTLEGKGSITVQDWNVETGSLWLSFNEAHLVYFKLCENECEVSSPDYDGGYQYDSHYVNIFGNISGVVDFEKVR